MASSTPAPNRPLSDTGHKRLYSLTSRQRRMGPAPLASFEDLSMDKGTITSDSSPEEKVNTLPQIGEETYCDSPSELSAENKGVLSIPTSPRIRISAASSPSQQSDSKDSSPENEHFEGFKNSEYCDVDMTDMRKDTDELNDEDQKRAKQKQERSEKIAEMDRREEALKINELLRKCSSSSVISDMLIPVTSAHSSRLSSLGSIGSPVRRSPSPHKMLLETSFCGSKPIQQPSIDIEDPPISAVSMIHHAIEKLESIKSPLDAKPPDIFRTRSPTPEVFRSDYSESNIANEIEDSPKPSRPLEASKLKQELTKSLQKRQEQQRRQAEHNEYQQRLVDQSDIFDRKMVVNIGATLKERRNSGEDRIGEYRTHSSERQSRLEKRSPRMGKKVLTPQVPDLRDLPRTSPSSPSMLGTEGHRFARSTKSSTPPSSPKSSKKGRKSRGHESDDSTNISTSRKSSFSSLFRKSDNAASPGTPESPGSINSGRKSPFSQFFKNAENKFRSRSRSRSRSKSRDRDLEDDTHDRRKKLSIFMPTKKKKNDVGKVETTEEIKPEESKLNDPINNVEFKFNNEGSYQSSSFGLMRQESENAKTTQVQNVQAPFDRNDSLAKLASLMTEANRTGSITENFSEEVNKSLREKEKEIMRQAGKINDLQEEVPEPTPVKKKLERKPSPNVQSNNLDVSNDHDPDSLSISESDKISEVEYLKKKQKTSNQTAESPDTEIKGLVSHDSFDDGELPYVPTTLPQERSVVAPMIPVKEREPILMMTQSIDRPRSTTPIQPSKLEEYKQSSQELLDPDVDKLTISIKVPSPGAVKVLPMKSPKRQDSKSWEDFCNEGLKSPRQLRKQLKEKQQSSEDSTPTTPASLTKTFVDSTDTVATISQSGARNWINFDEIPDIVLKPVRQIKTVPQKRQTPFASKNFDDNKTDMETMDGIDNVFEEQSPLVAPTDDSDKESSIHSSEDSDEEKHTSVSSSDELNTVRETIEDLKKHKSEESCENSDLERLLAPVNECINKLSTLTSQSDSLRRDSRKSPIPDNWEDFLLPPQPGRRSRLSSIGSEAGSLGGLRSPSPSLMLLETSFCGSQPIDDPALAEPDITIPMARKLSGISLGDLSPLTPSRCERGSSVHSAQYLCQPDRSSIMSDSSCEGGSSPLLDPCGGHSSHLNPFGMDLEVKSNRSSIISQEQTPPESPHHTSCDAS